MEQKGSNLGLVKLDTMLLMTSHFRNISSKEAVLFGHNDMEISPANLLHTSAEYIDYSQRFGLKKRYKKQV